MPIAEPPDVYRQQQREERKTQSPRLIEDNGAVHVLIVAALTAFVFFVLAKGVNFSDSTTLALIVFFVMSIAGVVRGENCSTKPASKPETTAQCDTVRPQTAADSDPCASQPKPWLNPMIESR